MRVAAAKGAASARKELLAAQMATAPLALEAIMAAARAAAARAAAARTVKVKVLVAWVRAVRATVVIAALLGA